MATKKKQHSKKSDKRGGTKPKGAGAGRSSRKSKNVPGEDFEGGKREEENSEALTIEGKLLNEAEDHEIENGTAGHDMELSEDESEYEDD